MIFARFRFWISGNRILKSGVSTNAAVGAIARLMIYRCKLSADDVGRLCGIDGVQSNEALQMDGTWEIRRDNTY